METKETIAQLVREPAVGPFSVEQAIPTAIVFIVAAAGGFVAFYRKWKDGNARAFNFAELIGELVVSGLCGVFAYWTFNGLGVNQWLAAAGVGIVGHMGSRALFMVEKGLERAFNRWAGRERRGGERREENQPGE